MQKTLPVPHDLHVVTMISNPRRYATRYRLYEKFAKHIQDSGAKLHTIELTFGDRPKELSNAELVLNTDSEIWHKEAAINLMVRRLPSDWKYLAWIDADIQFTRPDWVAETIHMLQHHDVVQPWSLAQDLDPSYEVFQQYRSFGWCYQQSVNRYSKIPPDMLFKTDQKTGSYGYGYGTKTAPLFWHTGYAWACTRNAWNHFGGLMDFAIVGSADHHMAKALIGDVLTTVPSNVSPRYREALLEWQNRALRHLQKDVGYCDGTIQHFWHGKKVNRKYVDRWEILIRNKYDPLLDLKYDWQGLPVLTDRCPRLRDDLRHYFSQRNEDGIDP